MIDNDYSVDGIQIDFVSGIEFDFKDNFNKRFSKKDIS